METQDRLAVAKSGDVHPWQGLESQLQRLVATRRGDVATVSGPEAEPETSIYAALLTFANSLSRRPWFNEGRLDAEQAAQEWFVQFWKTPLARFKADGPLFPYAYVMLKRVCLTLARRSQVRATQALPLDLISRGTPPEQQVTRQEAIDRVRLAVQRLTHEEQRLIADHYWRKWSVRRMAEHRSVTESAVSARLHRVRETLKALLANVGVFDAE